MPLFVPKIPFHCQISFAIISVRGVNGYLKLPERFEMIISANPLEGPLKTSITKFSEIYGESSSRLPLFPEYTLHGLDHFQQVLDATAWLINEQFLEHFSAEDVVVIVLSVLLHDSAMHLTEEGFATLIKSADYQNVISEMDHESWSEL
jgi:molecular chaperone HtpG